MIIDDSATRGPGNHGFPEGGRLSLYVGWLLVIASLLAWRSGNYYAGGIDPVVAAKAVLTSIAFVIMGVRFLRLRPIVGLGARTPLLIIAYVAVTWVGGVASGSFVSSGILGLRLLLTAATVALAMLVYPVLKVLESLMVALGAVGGLLAVTGVRELASRGRLHGGLLPVNPNQIALLLGPPIIWLVWRMLQAPCRLRDLFALLTLVALTLLTGSRTGLVAVAVGVMIVLAQARRIPRGGFFSLLALVPAIFYVFAFTGLVTNYVYRDGTGNVTTLNSRTIAWDAVLNVPMDFWQHYFGGGLSVKTIGVAGQYWSEQVFDSSWVSAYAQAGVVGVLVLAIWSLGSVMSTRRVPCPYRSVMLALIVCALIRSGLENGLLDSYVLFVTMLAPALASELVDQQTGRSPLSSAGLPAGPVIDADPTRPLVNGLLQPRSTVEVR